jgi:hypothetical protein
MRLVAFLLMISSALPPRPAPPKDEPAEVHSVRKFVQGFYDWYAPLAAKESDVQPLKVRRADFNPELVRALEADRAAQAKVSGYIVGLDWDPYLASQDSGDRYDIDVFALVAKAHGHWTFADFVYPARGKVREQSLIQILVRLRLDREKCEQDPKSCAQ